MKLNLVKQEVKELPADFFQRHKDLRELAVTGCNDLDELLLRIGQLQNLQKLDLCGNQFTALSPEIG